MCNHFENSLEMACHHYAGTVAVWYQKIRSGFRDDNTKRGYMEWRGSRQFGVGIYVGCKKADKTKGI